MQFLVSVLFLYFSQYNHNCSTINYKWKSVDGVLGVQTCNCRMEGADESTELWQLTGLIFLFRCTFRFVNILTKRLGTALSIYGKGVWVWHLTNIRQHLIILSNGVCSMEQSTLNLYLTFSYSRLLIFDDEIYFCF